MKVNNELCLRCGACVGSCPTNSVFLHETAFIKFLPTCTECGLCAVICPVGSISGLSESSSDPEGELVQEAGA